MTSSPPYPALSDPVDRLSFTTRIGILAGVLIAEKVFLNQFVDFERAQSSQGFGALIRAAQHFGFRFLVAFGASLAVLAYVRIGSEFQRVRTQVGSTPIRTSWVIMHFAMLALLAPATYCLYRDVGLHVAMAVVVVIWGLLAGAALSAALLALAPMPLWLAAAHALRRSILYAAIAAFVGAGLMLQAQMLWHPAAAFTFSLVRMVIGAVLPSLQADPVSLVLSTGRFAVQVSDECSGLEGIGLIIAFTGAWLLFFRSEYRFPRALLLLPAGICAIFALNVARIAILVLIGNAGYADIAIFGFHSQAGWIAFLAVSSALVIISRRSHWLTTYGTSAGSASIQENPTAPYVVPLLAILGAGMLAKALSGSFEYLYPLRLFAAGLCLWRFRKSYATLNWRFSWRAIATGAVIFAMWVMYDHYRSGAVAPMPARLAGMAPFTRTAWIICRGLAAIVTVPIAEELAYRGFLLRRLTRRDFDLVPFASVSWLALLGSSVTFGLAHGAFWGPGMIAGLGYGLLLRRTDRFGEAVCAHATSNALIAVAVLGFNQWQLW